MPRCWWVIFRCDAYTKRIFRAVRAFSTRLQSNIVLFYNNWNINNAYTRLWSGLTTYLSAWTSMWHLFVNPISPEPVKRLILRLYYWCVLKSLLCFGVHDIFQVSCGGGGLLFSLKSSLVITEIVMTLHDSGTNFIWYFGCSHYRLLVLSFRSPNDLWQVKYLSSDQLVR